MQKKILIGSFINKQINILKYFYEFTFNIESGNNIIDYLFINEDNISSEEFFEIFNKNNRRVEIINDFNKEKFTHIELFQKSEKYIKYKNLMIEKSLKGNYDYLLILDSGLLIHRNTILHLINLKKDIVGELFWEKNKENKLEPKAWNDYEYTFYRNEDREGLNINKIDNFKEEFIQKLNTPGTYEVGGLRGCLLISKEILEKGLNYNKIENLSLLNENVHFSIKAKVLGAKIFVDTTFKTLYLNDENDIERISVYKQYCEKISNISNNTKCYSVKKNNKVFLKDLSSNNTNVLIKDILLGENEYKDKFKLYELSNSLLLYNGIVIDEESNIINDIFPRERHVDLFLEPLIKNYGNNKDSFLVKPYQYIYLNDEFISLIGPWNDTFWHWFSEYLVKVVIAESGGYKGKYIIPNNVSFVLESLDLLNIPKNRIMIFNNNQNYLLKKLIIVENYEHYTGNKNLVALSLLRNIILKNIPESKNKYNNIYISRKNAKNARNISNEEELENLLKIHKVETVYMEKLSLKKQIELVSKCKTLIGGNGSGIFHSLFLPEKSNVIEFFSPNYTTSGALPTVELLKHNYYPITANNNQNYKFGNLHNAPIEVPLQLLNVTLVNLLYRNSYELKDKEKRLFNKSVDGVNYIIRDPQNNDDNLVILEVVQNDTYRLNNLNFLDKRINIVDIGGHIGAFSKFAKERFKNSRIFTFEPNNENIDLLKMNLSNLKDVEIYEGAVVGRIPEKVKIYNFKNNETSANGSWHINWSDMDLFRNGNKILSEDDMLVKDIPNLFLFSELFEKLDIDRIDLLKLDCEGSEFSILFDTDEEFLKRVNYISGELHPHLKTIDIEEEEFTEKIKKHFHTSGLELPLGHGYFFCKSKYI